MADQQFTPETHVDDAMKRLTTLKQGKKTATKHITQFKLLVQEAGLAYAGDVALIHFFQNTLNKPLLSKIFTSEQTPRTIEGWYKKAVQHDSNWRRQQTVMQPGFRPMPRPNHGSQTLRTPRDPNAMDVDRIQIGKLTPEERAQLIKEGRCFYCKEKGHTRPECPIVKAKEGTTIAATPTPTVTEIPRTPKPKTTSAPPKRMNGKERYKKIQVMLNDMTEEEAMEYYGMEAQEAPNNKDFQDQDQ